MEMSIDLPDELKSDPHFTVRGLALVAHPHPLMGGTMDNKVAQTMARAFNQLGYVSVRPNFRGVGGTAGAVFTNLNFYVRDTTRLSRLTMGIAPGSGGGGGSSGGGGSGYIGRLTSSGYTVVGNQATAAIVSDAGSNVRAGGPYSASNGLYTASNSPYFPSGSAYGSGNGSTGLVVIVPAVGTNPVQVGVSATLYSG